MTPAPIAVVGSGASGLLQALYLAKVRRRQVVILEQAAVVGGMFASEQTPFGPADLGAYLMQECGHAEIDAVLTEILPENQWHIYNGVKRDIAGNFFRGKLDQGSLYADLRQLAPADTAACWTEILARANGPVFNFEEASSLGAYIESRFGPATAAHVMSPIARKIWRQPPEQLSAWAAKFVHLTRVSACGPGDTLRHKQNPALDRVLGFPDQLAFPDSMFSHQRRSLYPRKFGLQGVVDALVDAIARHGVRILTGLKVTGAVQAQGAVNALTLETAAGHTTLPVSAVLWTTTASAALALLGQQSESFADPPIPHRIVYLFTDHPPETGPLYWFWSYDPETSWVRASVPGAYCPAANSNGLFPLCVETHVPSAATSDAEAVHQAAAEMRACGIIAPSSTIVGSHVLKAMRGYIVPSLANFNIMRCQRENLNAILPRNMYVSGQDPSTGIFFLPDIMRANAGILEKV